MFKKRRVATSASVLHPKCTPWPSLWLDRPWIQEGYDGGYADAGVALAVVIVPGSGLM